MTAAMQTGHRVLVVEDEPEIAEQLRTFVESRGDRPRLATTVTEALAALSEERFCYILCDQQLPTNAGDTPLVFGGERILKAARDIDPRRLGVSFHVMPVLVVTSYSSHADFVSKMYDLGASGFMEKPVKGREEKLQEKVTAAMARVGRGGHEACAKDAEGPAAAAGGDASEAPRAGSFAAQLGARTFADVGIKVVDGHTTRIVCQRRYMHVSFFDLGLANRLRGPTRQWDILLDLCAHHGGFRWKNYGDINVAKQHVFVLRKKLKEAFGLEDDPFHKFHAVNGWRARFFASSEIASDDS